MSKKTPKPSKRSKAEVTHNIMAMHEYAKSMKLMEKSRESYYFVQGAKYALEIALNAVSSHYDHCLYTVDGKKWAETPEELEEAIVYDQLKIQMIAGYSATKSMESMLLPDKLRELEASE